MNKNIEGYKPKIKGCNDCDFIGDLVYQGRCEECDNKRHRGEENE